jgi:hypothetical protein
MVRCRDIGGPRTTGFYTRFRKSGALQYAASTVLARVVREGHSQGESMRIRQVVIDSNNPYPLAEFWSLATGREVTGKANPYLVLEDPARQDVTLLIQRVDDDIKPGKNPVHIDLFAPNPEEEARRLVAAGAARVSTRKLPHKLIVLDDPQGNVFCLIDSGPKEL